MSRVETESKPEATLFSNTIQPELLLQIILIFHQNVQLSLWQKKVTFTIVKMGAHLCLQTSQKERIDVTQVMPKFVSYKSVSFKGITDIY